MRVYRRYLAIDPSITERYTSILLAPDNPRPRPLEAAKLLLSLARKAAKGQYTSPDSTKGPYSLLGEWIEVMEKYAEEVGMDIEEAEKESASRAKDATTQDAPPANGSNLIRFAGPPQDIQGQEPYDEDTDPSSARKLNVERIIKADGLELYKDQAGRLWTGLATYWLTRGEFEKARETFEAGIASVLTIRDFTQVFDSYAESQDTLISALMGALEQEEGEEAAALELEIESAMKEFEELMDRRPFLVNEVFLRRNPHDVQEWEKRIALYGENDEKVADTYTKALATISPKRATTNLQRVYVNFAKFYEQGGTTGEAEKDLDSGRKIFEKGTKVSFKTVDELAELYCEWAEMELRNECVQPTVSFFSTFTDDWRRNYDEAIRIMQRAAYVPKNTKVNYHDPVRRVGPITPHANGCYSRYQSRRACSSHSSFGHSMSIWKSQLGQ